MSFLASVLMTISPASSFNWIWQLRESFFFFYSLGRSATIRLCNTFSIEKILLVMRHKQILSQCLIKGCSLVCCDTRSQDIVYTSADVHPVLQGNLYRVFQRYRDIQSDSDNRNGLAPDSLEFVQVHCPQ